MGKGLIIIVLGLSSIITALIIDINSNSVRAMESTFNYYKQTQSRLISNSAVEIILEKLRRDKTLIGDLGSYSLMGGKYNARIDNKDSLLIITVNSSYEDVTHKTIVTAKRSLVSIPPVNSSAYISAGNSNLNLGGNIHISGFDHDANGNLTGAGTPLPGIGVDNSADSANIVNNLKPKIEKSIDGAGGAPSVTTVNSTTDWNDVTENYIFAADITLASGTYNGGTYGTLADPKITYVNGNAKFSGSAEGAGIMVINGNAEFLGNFTYRGIMIVYGQSTVTTRILGNSKFYGAMILVGQTVEISAASGSSEIYYSSAVIANAQSNIKSSRFDIVSWWE